MELSKDRHRRKAEAYRGHRWSKYHRSDIEAESCPGLKNSRQTREKVCSAAKLATWRRILVKLLAWPTASCQMRYTAIVCDVQCTAATRASSFCVPGIAAAARTSRACDHTFDSKIPRFVSRSEVAATLNRITSLATSRDSPHRYH